MIAATVERVRANLLVRGLFALYLLILVVWGSQPDARGQLVAALGIVIARIVGVMALGLLYIGIGLSPLEQFLTPSNAPVVDGAGQAWRSHQIWGVSALLGLSTMVLVGVIALIRLQRASH